MAASTTTMGRAVVYEENSIYAKNGAEGIKV
jgi:hypothetical protein